jgi:hypothetical protein
VVYNDPTLLLLDNRLDYCGLDGVFGLFAKPLLHLSKSRLFIALGVMQQATGWHLCISGVAISVSALNLARPDLFGWSRITVRDGTRRIAPVWNR